MARKCSGGTIYQRPGREGHYLEFSYRGERARPFAGRTLKEARKKQGRLIEMADTGQYTMAAIKRTVFGQGEARDRIRFGEAAELVLSERAHNKARGTVDMDGYRIGILKADGWERRYLDEITPKLIRRWLNARIAKGMALSTANRYHDAFSIVLEWGRLNEYIETNPARSVKRQSEKGLARELFLTHDQVEILLDAAPADFVAFLTIAVFGGLRRGEILALEWRDISLSRRTINIRAETAKGDISRVVDIYDRVYDVLAPLKAARDSADGYAPVLPRHDRKARKAAEDGTYARWTSTIARRRWETTLKAARKLPPEIRDELHIHDLRHTFASFLLSTGTSIFVVSKLMGHTSSYTTARYGHLHPDARREAAAGMNKAFAKPDKAKKTTARSEL